jgi:hypothetical protein
MQHIDQSFRSLPYHAKHTTSTLASNHVDSDIAQSKSRNQNSSNKVSYGESPRPLNKWSPLKSTNHASPASFSRKVRQLQPKIAYPGLQIRLIRASVGRRL